MPELPDVEVFRKYLESTSLHKEIAGVEAPGPRVLTGTSPSGLGRALKGRRFDSTRRHGKYLFVRAGGKGGAKSLVLHFGMTGYLEYFEGEPGPGIDMDHARVVVDFSAGARLAYIAPRQIGLVAWTGDEEGFIGEKDLGPDALEIDRDGFVELMAGRRGGVKSALMDQSLMAGVGNVYSDEILFQSGVRPDAKVADLGGKKLREMHRVMRRVLKAAVKARIDPERFPRGYLLPRREDGAECPRCGTRVKTMKAVGRTAYYCPKCQKG